MAWIAVRAGAGRILSAPHSTSTAGKTLCQVDAKSMIPIQAAFISGKAMRNKSNARPPPYPYETKKYRVWNAVFDRTTSRMDENSKIIVVDGPIAAGKNNFAKTLAEELDMRYLPACNMDSIYINAYGYDMRQLDPQMPAKCKSFDAKNFCLTPNDERAANFQIRMYMLRFSQYVDALGHLLSTGQGVVLNRCAYSDFVFLEAMVKNGFASKGAKSVYYELKSNTITELMKPHLVVYLDVPVSTVQDRIKKRNIPHEVNSKALTPKFLEAMEESYKQNYLKEISTHAELLVYDWSDYGEVEVVVEDIERIDFDRFDKHDPKMQDWRLLKEWDWAEARMQYTTSKYDLMNYFNVPRFDVPELVIDGYDAKHQRDVWESAPGMQYAQGYNTDQGDGSVLLKTGFTDYRNPK